MLPEERKAYICEIINQKKSVKVSDLSKEMGLTEATIRRDLDELQNAKKLRRTHGGAVALHPVGMKYVISDLSSVNVEEKKKIAKRTYEFIEDGDTLLLDASSTVQELAKIIAVSNKKRLTVLTNSFAVVSILKFKNDISIIHIGGTLERELDSTVGSIAENILKNIRVDKVFISVNGISDDFGYSITNLQEAAIKAKMLACSRQSFVLADNTKFGDAYLAKVADFFGVVDYLITDTKIEDFDYKLYKQAVKLIVADKD